jgi:CHRD domain
VPPTTSTASGGVGFILNAGRNEVRYDGSVKDLMPTVAHVHDNVAGMNGPVLFPLMLTGTTVSGNQPLMPDQITKLTNAGLYVNFHSMEFQAGAVRGQITVPTLMASPPPAPPP